MKLLTALAVCLPALALATPRPAPPPLRATAELTDAAGKPVGRIHLEQTAQGVLLSGEVHDLPPGDRAIHFHEVGRCEAPFQSAGAHFNPHNKAHGLKSPKGRHAGDLPNLTIPEGGRLKFEVFTQDVTLRKGKTSLFDKDGSSIIIHANADDHVSAPAGNAGDRIACGVVKPAAAAEGAGPQGAGATGEVDISGTLGRPPAMPTDPGMSAGADAGVGLPGQVGGGRRDSGGR